MKKYSNAIFVVFLIIFAAGLWLFNSNITRVPLLSDDNFYFVKAKVVEVVEDNTVNKEVNGGSQNVKVEITKTAAPIARNLFLLFFITLSSPSR